jgi:hypothetical protein
MSIEAMRQAREVFGEVLETLKRAAPGTPLNNHRFDGLGIRAYAAIAALDAVLAATPKPLDDPRLQGLFSDAISGALAFGAQNTNPPPAGHWLERFWQMGRAELSEAAAPAAEPVALTDEVLRYAMAAMGTGSPMDAEKFRLFWRYAHDAAMGQPK